MNKLIPEKLMQYIEYLGTTVEWLEDNLEIVQENTIPNEEISRDLRALSLGIAGLKNILVKILKDSFRISGMQFQN